jgi:AraC-like DNA-binding protein
MCVCGIFHNAVAGTGHAGRVASRRPVATSEVSARATAAACGFSERYFAKLFREQTNQTIGHLLKSAQISKGAELSAAGETPGRFRAANRTPATG